MDRDKIFVELRSFIAQQLLNGEDDSLDASTPLLEWGVLDSLSMLTLLSFIEEKLNIYVPDDQVRPEHFENLRVLTDLLEKLPLQEKKATRAKDMVQIVESYGVKKEVVELDADNHIHTLTLTGQEPTWLLLPNLGTPSTAWGEMLRPLVDEQSLIAVDLLGFGLSKTSKNNLTYNDHLDSLEKFLSVKVKSPVILIGASTGAMLATELARRHPDLVKALILLSFGLVEEPKKWWQNLAEISKVPNQFLEYSYYKFPTFSTIARASFEEAFIQDAYYTFFDEKALEQLPKSFESITQPTLFVGGLDDRIFPKATIEAAAARVPNSKIDWLPRCGHFPQVERPHELLLVLQSFVRECLKMQIRVKF